MGPCLSCKRQSFHNSLELRGHIRDKFEKMSKRFKNQYDILVSIEAKNFMNKLRNLAKISLYVN